MRRPTASERAEPAPERKPTVRRPAPERKADPLPEADIPAAEPAVVQEPAPAAVEPPVFETPPNSD